MDLSASIRLRDFESADAELFPWLLDHQRRWHQTNGPYFGLPGPAEAATEIARFQELARTDTASLPIPRTMLGIAAPDGALIGMVSWYWYCQNTDWRRMGIVIQDEAWWGRGVGTAAMSLWTTYLFDHTDALRLDFATYSGNPAMLAIGRRLGFVEEGRFRHARRWSGGVHDAVVMGVLRHEWNEHSRPGATPASHS